MYYGLICPHQRLGEKGPARPSWGFPNVEGSRSSLDIIAGVRAEVEVGIQLKALDLRTLLKGATSSRIHTWEWSQDWWVSDLNRVTLDFWWAMTSCFSFANFTKAVGIIHQLSIGVLVETSLARLCRSWEPTKDAVSLWWSLDPTPVGQMASPLVEGDLRDLYSHPLCVTELRCSSPRLS